MAASGCHRAWARRTESAELEEASAQTGNRRWQAMRGRVAQSCARMRGKGMSIISLAPADLPATLQTAAAATIGDRERQSGDEGHEILARYPGGKWRCKRRG